MFNGNTKSPLKSLTIIASILGIIASFFGLDLSPEDQALIVANLDSIISAVLFFVAIYGRVRATTKIQV